jgi:hypothetical protein
VVRRDRHGSLLRLKAIPLPDWSLAGSEITSADNAAKAIPGIYCRRMTRRK